MEDKRLGILVVDDHLSISELLKTILKDKYAVMTAATGGTALQTLKETNIHIVLLDLRLPDYDGLNMLKTIKERYPDI